MWEWVADLEDLAAGEVLAELGEGEDLADLEDLVGPAASWTSGHPTGGKSGGVRAGSRPVSPKSVREHPPDGV